MGFKMKSGMKPSFKMMGSTPVKQYADKNVSVDKVSADGRTFTGTDSKGNTAEYLTNAYDAEIMQSDSVGVTGNAVSNMQMEYDMVKGTKYEQDFIDYHGKGDKPGTGKTTTPTKQLDWLDSGTDTNTDTSGDGDNKTKTEREPRGEDTRTRTEYTGRKSPDYTIVSDDGKTTTRNVTKRGGTKTIKLEDGDGEPTVKTNKRGKKTTTPPKVKMTKTKRSGKVIEKEISKGRAERMRRRGRRKGQEYDETGSPIKQKAEAKADPKVGKQIAEWGYIPGSINKKNNTIVAEDGSLVDMAKATRGGKTLLQHLKEGTISGPPTKQTSHGPIKEFHPPMNPNEGPYIVRARQEMAKRQADMNYDGPDYKHIRLNEKTGLDDGPHPERPLKQVLIEQAPATILPNIQNPSTIWKPLRHTIERMPEPVRTHVEQLPTMITKPTKTLDVVHPVQTIQMPTMVTEQKKTAKRDNK